MSVGLVAFLYAVVIVAMVAICLGTVYLERLAPSEKYDERQKIARGNAYRFSFLLSTVYYIFLLFYFTLGTGRVEWTLEPFLLVTIGILIQMDSFHIYCVLNHCALPLGEKPKTTIVCYCVMGITYLVQYYMLYIPEDVVGLSDSGSRSMNLFRLLISFSFFSLAILHLISCLRKEDE